MAKPALKFTASPEALKQMRDMASSANNEIQRLLLTARDLSPKEKAQLMKQFDSIMMTLDKGTKTFMETWVPYHYTKGQQSALDDISKIATPKITALTGTDQAVMQNISDRAFTKLTTAYRTLRLSYSQIINNATRAQIQESVTAGVNAGSTLRTVKKTIMQNIADNGLAALKDKAGKQWQLDTYSEMVARTEMANTSRDGRSYTYMQNGYDLVQIDGYGSPHQACADWEYQVVSLTGDTDGYPTIDDAIGDGLFHPNCLHNYVLYTQDLANL